MIVKIQRPLITNGVPTILVYNRSRRVQWQEPFTPKWEKWFGSHLKRYAKAHRSGTTIVIDHVVKDREW